MFQKIFYIVCLEQRKTNPPLPPTATHPPTHHNQQKKPIHNHRNPQPPQPNRKPTHNHRNPSPTTKPTTTATNHRNKSPQPTTQDPLRTTSHPPEIKPQTKIHFRQERARSTRGFGCARLTREGGVGLCEIDERG